jgi:antitoxin CcdA
MALLRSPHHPFDAWIRAQGKTRLWAAEHLQTTKASLSRIINGKQWPGPEFFERVESLTKGQVTADHFINPKKHLNELKSLPDISDPNLDGMREVVRIEVQIDSDLVAEAVDLGIDIEALASHAICEKVKQEKMKRWQAEHADVVAWYNDHIERDGIFGEEWRTF